MLNVPAKGKNTAGCGTKLIQINLNKLKINLNELETKNLEHLDMVLLLEFIKYVAPRVEAGNFV